MSIANRRLGFAGDGLVIVFMGLFLGLIYGLVWFLVSCFPGFDGD